MNMAVPFAKYTSFGNNFVLIDETQDTLLHETDKQRFAYFATNGCFGIGSDNFIVIQPCTANVLQQINATFGYWEKLPDVNGIDFIFRMFEPDGTEALSCGNGLMCIARHLHHYYGINASSVLTQIPLAEPKVVHIGIHGEDGGCYAELGHPQRAPGDLVREIPRHLVNNALERVERLTLRNLRKSDAIEFLSNQTTLIIDGYLVFTGEPHFVLFVDDGNFPSKINQYLFSCSADSRASGGHSEKRLSTGNAFVNFIGNYFNTQFQHYFPKGISVNFVRRPFQDKNLLEYRCFERGIRKETLACGTGALACAYTAKHCLGLISDHITIWPYLCRLQQSEARIGVQEKPSGWRISGDPVLLVDGVFSPRKAQLPYCQIDRLNNSAPEFQSTLIQLAVT